MKTKHKNKMPKKSFKHVRRFIWIQSWFQKTTSSKHSPIVFFSITWVIEVQCLLMWEWSGWILVKKKMKVRFRTFSDKLTAILKRLFLESKPNNQTFLSIDEFIYFVLKSKLNSNLSSILEQKKLKWLRICHLIFDSTLWYFLSQMHLFCALSMWWCRCCWISHLESWCNVHWEGQIRWSEWQKRPCRLPCSWSRANHQLEVQEVQYLDK